MVIIVDITQNAWLDHPISIITWEFVSFRTLIISSAQSHGSFSQGISLMGVSISLVFDILEKPINRICRPSVNYLEWYAGVLYANQGNGTNMKIGHPTLGVDFMTGYHDSSSSNGRRATCLVDDFPHLRSTYYMIFWKNASYINNYKGGRWSDPLYPQLLKSRHAVHQALPLKRIESFGGTSYLAYCIAIDFMFKFMEFVYAV